MQVFCALTISLVPLKHGQRSQFMGACILENGDTIILMELMLGGTLFEAIATDRVSWHKRCRLLCLPAGCQLPVPWSLTPCSLLATAAEGIRCRAPLLSAVQERVYMAEARLQQC